MDCNPSLTTYDILTPFGDGSRKHNHIFAVEPLYYGHQGDREKCLYYEGVHFREINFIWISVSQRPSKLSVIERFPYYRGVHFREINFMRISVSQRPSKLSERCPYYRGVHFREINFMRISVSQRPSKLSIIERCPYYRSVHKGGSTVASNLYTLTPMSQMEVGCPGARGAGSLPTQTQVGRTPHKPALPATQPRAPPATQPQP